MAITIAGSGITSANIADGTITNADINSSAAIDGSKVDGSFGKVLQVVSVSKVDAFTTTSSSFVDITGLTVTITPTSTTSKILVQYNTITGNGTAGWTTWVQLVRDTTNLSQSTIASAGRNGSSYSIDGSVSGAVGTSLTYLDSPATTAAIIYKLQLSSEGASTGTVNRRGDGTADGGSSSITVMEIGA